MPDLQDEHLFGTSPVDDSILAVSDLACFETVGLGNDAAARGKICETLHSIEQTKCPSRRGSRLVLGNVGLDLVETSDGQRRPDQSEPYSDANFASNRARTSSCVKVLPSAI